ncbi:MAG: hypothetical protein R6W70_08510 [bacterium]
MKKWLLFAFLFVFIACSSEGTTEDSSEKTDFDSWKNTDTDAHVSDNSNTAEDDEQDDSGGSEEVDHDDKISNDADKLIDKDNGFSDEDELSDDDSDVAFPDDDNDTDELPDEDIPEQTEHVSIIDNGDGTSTASIMLNSETDAVSAYLMDPPSGSWNYFHGDTVKLGFKEISSDTFVAFHTALRFTHIPVENSTDIISSELSFLPHNNVDSSNTIYLNIYGEKQADSQEFDVSNYSSNRPDQRVKTENHIEEWGINCIADTGLDPCYGDEEYCEQRAKDCWDKEIRYNIPRDISNIISEITELSQWKKGNSLTFIISGMYPSQMPDEEKPEYSGNRTLIGYDISSEKGKDYLPVLKITYSN